VEVLDAMKILILETIQAGKSFWLGRTINRNKFIITTWPAACGSERKLRGFPLACGRITFYWLIP